MWVQKDGTLFSPEATQMHRELCSPQVTILYVTPKRATQDSTVEPFHLIWRIALLLDA